MDVTQSASSIGLPIAKPASPPRADVSGPSASTSSIPMSEGGAVRREDTIIIEEETVPDLGADTVVSDTTGAGNMGAGIETTRTPDAPESSQQQPPASQQQPQPQQQTPPQQ